MEGFPAIKNVKNGSVSVYKLFPAQSASIQMCEQKNHSNKPLSISSLPGDTECGNDTFAPPLTCFSSNSFTSGLVQMFKKTFLLSEKRTVLTTNPD